MNNYQTAEHEAKEAQFRADFMKTRGLGDVEATLSGGDGEHAASQAAKHAKAAVDGVEGAKKAMATAEAMLTAAEQAAKQSEADASTSVQEDRQDMSKIVRHAVQAAQSAEKLKIESLRLERQKALKTQDAAYRHAEEQLRKQRDDALRLGDAEIESSKEKMRQMEADSPSHIANAISNRMQKVSSPQKLAALSSTLVQTMGHAPIGDATIAALPHTLGEAVPSTMSQDEHVFDHVLNEMKQAEQKTRVEHSPQPKTVPMVTPGKLKQLANEQAEIAKDLNAVP